MADNWQSQAPAEWEYDTSYDGRGHTCGDALLELKILFGKLAPAVRVLVYAGDDGAIREYPVWCRLTGHRLVAAEHPFYILQNRDH